MKKFAVACISLVFVIAAAMLLYLFFQYNQPIVADDPQTEVSSESVVSSEQPAIEVPVAQDTEPVDGDAIVPTVESPAASEPTGTGDVDKPSTDTSSVTTPDKPVDTNNPTDTSSVGGSDKPVTPENPKSDPPANDDNTPTGGETYNGKIYVPGFGWVEYSGEGTHEVWDMNPNGNIVGY